MEPHWIELPTISEADVKVLSPCLRRCPLVPSAGPPQEENTVNNSRGYADHVKLPIYSL